MQKDISYFLAAREGSSCVTSIIKMVAIIYYTAVSKMARVNILSGNAYLSYSDFGLSNYP